jgi:hypothetical protein
MKKEEIERHINTLSNTYDNCYFLNSTTKEGRRKTSEEIKKCKRYMISNLGLLSFIIERCETNYQEEIILLDFFSKDYFLNNLGEYISKLKILYNQA